MAQFRLEAYQRDGNFLGILPARNIQGECFMNRADALRWEMPLYEKDLNLKVGDIYPGKIEVALYRQEQVIFRGPLWDATASSKRGNISCAAEGLESYLDVRRVDWDLNVEAEQASVMWDLIEASQALTEGDLGIIDGSHIGTGPTRLFQIRRKEGKYISDVIKETAGLVDGFDWLIEHDNRAFRTWYPHKGGTANTLLEYGAGIENYTIQLMGKWAANDILAQGPKEMVDTAIDEFQREIWGLRQTTVQYKDAPTREALQDFASRTRKMRQKGKFVPHVTVRGDRINPFKGDIELGNTVGLLIHDGAVSRDEEVRMVGFQYTIGLQDNETFVLYLNSIDEIQE